MVNHFHAIETAESDDGCRRWQLLGRADGFFFYEEETFQQEVYWVDDDGGERDIAAESYWSCTHISGLFDTIESARKDAFGTLSWLISSLDHEETNDS